MEATNNRREQQMEANGAAPYLPPIEEQMRLDLEALIEKARERTDVLAAELEVAQATLNRYQGTLKALTGEPRKKPGPKQKNPNKRADGKDGHDWFISEGKIEEIWQAIQQYVKENDSGTFIATHVADGRPFSPEATRRALTILRERELVRQAGTGRGGSTVWALMPNIGQNDNSKQLETVTEGEADGTNT